MIKIPRPTKEPRSLRRSGKKQAAAMCAAYEICPEDYISDKKRLDHSKRNYYASKAKILLMGVCCSKCCYCEERFSRANLHVEHFRPKGGVRQTRKQECDDLPGYYWLENEWDNLLLSCAECNSWKSTLFPLANPKERARWHGDPVGVERPLLIDPVREDPRIHICFEGDRPFGLTRQGRVTIAALGLRRKHLREVRRDKLMEIYGLCVIMAAAAERPDRVWLQVEAERARRELRAAVLASSEFSSMVRDYLEPRCF